MKQYVKQRIKIPNNIKLKRLTNILQTDIILFSGVLDSKTWSHFEEIKPSISRLTILTRGRGGLYFNCRLRENLGQFLRKRYQIIDIVVLDYANSALSVLALSSDNLYLLQESSGIGTIDPRVGNDKSCFELIKLKDLSFDGKNFTLTNSIVANSVKDNIEFTLDYSYASIKQGNILSKEEGFYKQFRIMLGIAKDSKIDFIENHSTVIRYNELEQIGLKIKNLNPDIAIEISEVYSKLIALLGDNRKDEIDYYVFDIQYLNNYN